MLNTIPDDCIMEIFSYLGEMDLNEMICVSHQMLYFGQLQLKKVNRYGTLRIVESEYGHAFTLKSDSYRHYCFTLTDSNYCSRGKRFTINGDMNNKHEKMFLFEKHYLTKYAPVPSIFLSHVDKFLEKHSFNELILKNASIIIWIDSEFITYLEETVQEIESLGLIGVKIEDNCMERLYLFVSKLKLSSFFIRQSESALITFNNTNFVEKFFRETKCTKGGDFFIDSPEYLTENGRFYLSKVNAVDYLSRCYILENLSLTIDPRWIPEIIEERMKHWSGNLFNMVIGLSEMPTVWDFSAYSHLTLHRYEGQINQRHVVIDTETGKLIYFEVYTENNIICFHQFFVQTA